MAAPRLSVRDRAERPAPPRRLLAVSFAEWIGETGALGRFVETGSRCPVGSCRHKEVNRPGREHGSIPGRERSRLGRQFQQERDTLTERHQSTPRIRDGGSISASGFSTFGNRVAVRLLRESPTCRTCEVAGGVDFGTWTVSGSWCEQVAVPARTSLHRLMNGSNVLSTAVGRRAIARRPRNRVAATRRRGDPLGSPGRIRHGSTHRKSGGVIARHYEQDPSRNLSDSPITERTEVPPPGGWPRHVSALPALRDDRPQESREV